MPTIVSAFTTSTMILGSGITATTGLLLDDGTVLIYKPNSSPGLAIKYNWVKLPPIPPIEDIPIL